MHIIALDKSMTVLSKIENLLHEIGIEDLEISLFTDANEALDFMEDNNVRMVFSSIETEGIDGITFVDIILRKQPDLLSKLFIVTSQKDTDDFHDIKDVGAKRFIKKPINEEHFKHFVTPEIVKILKNN